MKTKLLRLTALLLALILCTVLSVSCTSSKMSGKTMLTLSKDGITVSLSVNYYELMLSRMKGVLYASGESYNGMNAATADFWNVQDTFNGTDYQTRDEFYRDLILENCKTALVILYLFEKHVGDLSTTDKEELSQLMNELVQADGQGSKTKLNAVLKEFGVNYDILEDVYALESFQKPALKQALYGDNASLVGPNVKNDYLLDNFVRFRQIFVATYNYVYETDENGDEIYYYPEGHESAGRIYYDKNNGETFAKTDGSVRTDKNGDVMYFVRGSKGEQILYDTVNGVRAVKIKDTLEETTPMTPEEKDEARAEAQSLFSALQDASNEEFEAELVAREKRNGNTNYSLEYDDGFYLARNISYTQLGFSYMDEIIRTLDGMKDGEVALVPSDQGYHIIKKYAPTESAYEKEENLDYFFNDYFDFNNDLMEQLLLDECEKYYADIKVNEKVVAAAPSMKEVAINGIQTYY